MIFRAAGPGPDVFTLDLGEQIETPDRAASGLISAVGA